MHSEPSNEPRSGMIVHPVGTVGRELALPDRHPHLQRIDRKATGQKGFIAMSGRRHDDDRRVSDFEVSHPMGDCDSGTRPLPAGFFGDLLHLALGHFGVGLVFEMIDRVTAGPIPNTTDETDGASRVRAVDSRKNF